MLRVLIADGSSHTVSRRLEGPICIPAPSDGASSRGELREAWFVVPDASGETATVHGDRYQPLARLAPGERFERAELSVHLSHDDGDAAPTDPVVTLPGAPALALELPGAGRVALATRPLVLGSARDCDVVLDDVAVSARHARVHRLGEAWMLTDLGSTNGLWIGGARVPAAMLAPGVAVTLGRSRVACVADEIARRTAPASTLVGTSPAMARVRADLARFAPAPYPVLVEGESGVGKELVARELHRLGPNPEGPLVTVNCAAIAPDVIESELFGHERGAFTGAVGRRRGLFEEAHRGTLFLDEIGDLPLPLQVKLLRVLETGELRRVGGEQPIRARPRVVSATLRDLSGMVAAGHFREDLYFRLADFRVRVPPLRDRPGDLPLLVGALLARIGVETGRHRRLEDRALGVLLAHPWPGNVRELLAVLKRAVFATEAAAIGPKDLALERSARVQALRLAPTPVPVPSHPEGWPREVPEGDLEGLHRYCAGNLSRMACITGLARSTLRERMRRLGRYAAAAQAARLTDADGDPRMSADDPDP